VHQRRTVLQFAFAAGNSPFAVTVNFCRLDSQCGNGFLRQHFAKLFAPFIEQAG
jgi:hypothetical protein